MTPFPREAYRPLEPYAPDRRPIEVDLSDNTNRWGPHPEALRAVHDAPATDLTRYPAVYADALKQAIARRFDVPLDRIATGCGSDDLLDSAFRASGEPGEAISYMPPTFSMIEIFARMNGMIARPIEGPSPDPEALVADGPALVYLCRPNNPTGGSAPRDWVERLVDLVEPDGPILLVDEAYADFADDDLIDRAAESRRVVVLRTLSKAYGLAGMRLGFAVGPAAVVAEIEKSRGPYKVNRMAERAAVLALADEEGWVPRVVADTRAGRDRLTKLLRARGLAPLPSDANFVLVPVSDADAVTAALRERGVAVRPFPDLPRLGDAIRVSIGPSRELDRFIAALDEILDPLDDRP